VLKTPLLTKSYRLHLLHILSLLLTRVRANIVTSYHSFKGHISFIATWHVVGSTNYKITTIWVLSLNDQLVTQTSTVFFAVKYIAIPTGLDAKFFTGGLQHCLPGYPQTIYCVECSKSRESIFVEKHSTLIPVRTQTQTACWRGPSPNHQSTTSPSTKLKWSCWYPAEEMTWPSRYRTGLQREWSRIKSWLRMSCSVLRQDDLLSQWPHSTQVYKRIPVNLVLGITLRWTSIPSRWEKKYS